MLINARESPLYFHFFIILSFIEMVAKRKKMSHIAPVSPTFNRLHFSLNFRNDIENVVRFHLIVVFRYN
jgi:hypothetical protein